VKGFVPGWTAPATNEKNTLSIFLKTKNITRLPALQRLLPTLSGDTRERKARAAARSSVCTLAGLTTGVHSTRPSTTLIITKKMRFLLKCGGKKYLFEDCQMFQHQDRCSHARASSARGRSSAQAPFTAPRSWSSCTVNTISEARQVSHLLLSNCPQLEPQEALEDVYSTSHRRR